MRKISYKNKEFENFLDSICSRRSYPSEIEKPVKSIIDDVRKKGDMALCFYAEKFDGADLTPDCLRISKREIQEAARLVDAGAKKAISSAIEHVSVFAKKKIPKNWRFSPRQGVSVGEKFEAFDRVGVYVPGGTAPLVSTAIHTVAIAKTAGVREIAAVTPPGKNGEIPPSLIYALDKAGATEIFRLGGVYAIAALAYGTESVRKVEKIVGPGNAYVAAAKRIVYGDVAIDMIAGPSEIMIIADSKSNPAYIAADLLSQAEHGSGYEQAVLLSSDSALIQKVEAKLKEQSANLSRSETLNKVLNKGVFLVEVRDIRQASEIASRYAPEHLEILCANPENVAESIKAAGAIFIGEWTPEAVGDFSAGPSHVLPTGGTARFFSGLTVEHFFRRISVIKYNKKALEKELPVIAKFAEIEGLDAHGNSVAIRLAAKNK